ncbi:sulfite exporter TauE/SafE family protein [uncultured Mailhella sp.]|uniref:sulfite exporter TauE/SafE family protein n=1 Tax=uncultured Mailhella sp. TaxID=1981031 RepID=UPI00320B485B
MILAHVIWLAFAWLLGGFVHGVTSIGAAMVAMPLITFIASPKEAILIACISSGVAPLALSIIYRRYILWKEMIWLSLGCIVGIPAGVAMLSVLSGTVLMLTIGVLLIFFVSWQFFSHKVRATLPYHPVTALIIGTAGAFLTASTSLGGPILAVYTAFRGWEQKNALATTSMYFNFVNASIIVMQRKAGLYSSAVYDAVSISLTFAVIGVLISIPVVRRMPQETFRKLLLLMIFISGVTLLSRSVM